MATQRRDFGAAERAFTRAIEAKDDNLYAFGQRAIARMNLRDFDGAVADTDVLIEMQPDNAFSYNIKGYALSQGRTPGCACRPISRL